LIEHKLYMNNQVRDTDSREPLVFIPIYMYIEHLPIRNDNSSEIVL